MCKESKLVVPLCFHFSAYRVGYNKNTINPCVLVSVNAHLQIIYVKLVNLIKPKVVKKNLTRAKQYQIS